MELYGGSRGIAPNDTLPVERCRAFDCGVTTTLQDGRWFVSLGAFRNDTRDGTLWIPSGPKMAAKPCANTRSDGLELTVEAAPIRWLRLVSRNTWQESRFVSDVYDYKGDTLPNTPARAHALIAETGPFRGITLRYTMESFSRQYRDQANMQRIPPYALHHARIAWRLSGAITATGSVENIADHCYEPPYSSFPYPGRQFTGALTITFK